MPTGGYDILNVHIKRSFVEKEYTRTTTNFISVLSATGGFSGMILMIIRILIGGY